MMRHMFTSTFVLAALGLLLAALNSQPAVADGMGMDAEVSKAIALVHPLEGQQVRGKVTFTETSHGLRIQGEFWNLEPGSHGFHVHEYADCSAPNEGSVGPHYLPMEKKEGDKDAEGMHDHGDMSYYGDLPPIEADQEGRATYDAERKGLSLHGPRSVIGRGLLVHALSGEKIGCGVIGIARK